MNESSLPDLSDSWVAEYLAPRHPDLVVPYLEARGVYAVGLACHSLDRPEVERLLTHARSARTPLGENAAAMLGELCASIPELGEAIRMLAAGRRVHERINALVALATCPPTELHVELLGQLLHDKSARVRMLAADKIVHHQLRQLASALEAAVDRESSADVVDGLRADLDYLRQGFHVRRADGNFWVSCRLAQGGFVGRLFTPDAYQAEGAAWIGRTLTEHPARA